MADSVQFQALVCVKPVELFTHFFKHHFGCSEAVAEQGDFLFCF